MAIGRKEQVLLATLLLTSISAVCLLIGTVTTHWFGTTEDGRWDGIGTFCRNTEKRESCLYDGIDALCVVSLILLGGVIVALTLQLVNEMITSEIGRFIIVGLLFVASILLLGIISAVFGRVGFSFGLVITGCAFAQLLLLISGIRLGEMFRSESSETLSNHTERPLLFLSRGLFVLIALFTILGMATKQWLGYRTTEGWIGAGTFCRQSKGEGKKCDIRLVTTLLSVAASGLSLAGLAMVVCAILNLLPKNVERITLTVISFVTSVFLWTTISTVIDPSEMGFSF